MYFLLLFFFASVRNFIHMQSFIKFNPLKKIPFMYTYIYVSTGPPSTPTLHSPVCTPINSTSVGVAVSWSGPLYMYDVVDGYTLTAQGPVGDCTPESPCQLTSLERERDFVLEFGESYVFTVSATNCQSSSCGEAQTSEDAETTVNLSHPGTYIHTYM